MNNVITILVDSVFSECLGSGRTEESSTPFIDKLISEGIFTPNVYSYGPYTDAATKGLYSGHPSLRDYGYYFGLNSSEQYHFRTFKENGFETYAFYYPYYLIGPRVRKYIDHTVYTGGFDFPAVWLGKFGYYSERKKKQGLTPIEYKILIEYSDLCFDCWLNFYNRMENDIEASSILRGIQRDSKNNHSILLSEYRKYNEDKAAYIDNLLDSEEEHILSKINDYVYDDAIDVDWINKYVYKKHRRFFKKLDRKEFWLNIKNNKFSFSKCLKSKTYLKNVIICLFSGKYSRYTSRRPGWQLVSSMQKKLDAVFDILETRPQTNKPFYISLHTEEPHNCVTYFSYDIQNEKLIDDEIAYLSPLLDNCGSAFKGNLMYQLSLRHIDLCVKRLVDKLDLLGILNSTTIALISDHGTSYSYNPIRSSVVNNFFKENYRTPLLIWNSNRDDCKGKNFHGLYSAEDVQCSLCTSLGMKIPKEYTGHSVMDFPEGRKVVVTEYMGPGCPDMLSREVWMMARNLSYSIAYKIPICSDFNANNVSELYDLVHDPLELVNIAGSIKIAQIPALNELITAIDDRFTEIRLETKSFIDNIENWKSII